MAGGVYHCLLDGVTTSLPEEMELHIRTHHRGMLGDVDVEEFFYPEGESFRAYCARDSRGRPPGCGWERYLTSEAEAKRLADRHSNRHQAEYERFGGATPDQGARER